jgi:hypothetical protein
MAHLLPNGCSFREVTYNELTQRIFCVLEIFCDRCTGEKGKGKYVRQNLTVVAGG